MWQLFAAIPDLIKLFGAVSVYLTERAKRRQAIGEGRTQAYAEALKDASVLIQDIADAERSHARRVRDDYDGLLASSPYNRANWPERDTESEDG